MTRVYLVPKIGTGAEDNSYRPKYFFAPSALGMAVKQIAGGLSGMDYGLEPVFLVAADVTNAEHTLLAAQADVVVVPVDLDATVGASLGTVQMKLEGFNIPADWVTSGMTYKAVLKWVTRLFALAQRLHQMGAVRLIPVGVTLDSMIGDLSSGQRQKLQQVAASFSANTDAVTSGTTLREALRLIADQLPPASTLLGQAL